MSCKYPMYNFKMTHDSILHKKSTQAGCKLLHISLKASYILMLNILCENINYLLIRSQSTIKL